MHIISVTLQVVHAVCVWLVLAQLAFAQLALSMHSLSMQFGLAPLLALGHWESEGFGCI